PSVRLAPDRGRGGPPARGHWPPRGRRPDPGRDPGEEMALSRGPGSFMLGAVRPPHSSKDRPSFSVGSRVLLRAAGGSGRVTLTDDAGTSAVATLADGIEVELLAWRPRHGG